MCLLAKVLSFDAERIECLCTSHRDLAHPLRAHGRLGIAAGIELCSQAMAAHAALSAPSTGGVARAGLLASLRSVRFAVERLDDIDEDLLCCAQRLAGDALTAMYEFTLRAAGRCLMSGRATVILNADAADGAADGGADNGGADNGGADDGGSDDGGADASGASR
jgi:predicted hotdog family 3-hydroxylacyl-ACP dehydratase